MNAACARDSVAIARTQRGALVVIAGVSVPSPHMAAHGARSGVIERARFPMPAESGDTARISLTEGADGR